MLVIGLFVETTSLLDVEKVEFVASLPGVDEVAFTRLCPVTTAVYVTAVTGTFPPEVSTPVFPSGSFPPLPHAKYAVDTNLFRLESQILMREKRATNRNNVGGEVSPQG